MSEKGKAFGDSPGILVSGWMERAEGDCVLDDFDVFIECLEEKGFLFCGGGAWHDSHPDTEMDVDELESARRLLVDENRRLRARVKRRTTMLQRVKSKLLELDCSPDNYFIVEIDAALADEDLRDD